MKKNISTFKEFLSDKKNICLVGKGTLNDSIPDNYDLYVGIKQSINVCPRKDVFILNDFEGVFGVEKCFKDIKFILCPNKPHVEWKVCDITYNNIYKYAKSHGFTGKMIIYELWTNSKKNKDLQVLHSFNSADIFLYFLKIFKMNACNINYYGVCSSIDENKSIINEIKNAKVSNEYKEIYESYLRRTFDVKKDRSTIVKNAHKLIKKKIHSDFNNFKITFH